MKARSIMRVVGAVVLATVLAFGAVAPAPAGADPADTYLPTLTTSPQFNMGGCLYRVQWGNFSSTAFMWARFYNLSACGGAVVAINYAVSTTTDLTDYATAVTKTGTDGCGAYQLIQASSAVSGIALRGLVWVGTGSRWYANDGTVFQTGTVC